MIRPVVMCERHECYIGSTNKRLILRFWGHRLYNSTARPASSKQLFERYGEDRLEIIQLEECGEDDRFIRERWWIENTLCVNKCVPFRTDEERKDVCKMNQKRFAEKHREELKEIRKIYREDNKEHIAETKRIWKQNNKKRIAEWRQKWKTDNPEKYAESLRREAERKRIRRQALKNTSQ